MSMGVRAEIAVHGTVNCPVATLSTDTEAPVKEVTWTRGNDGRVTEEFRLDAKRTDTDPAAIVDADPILDVGDDRVYRFRRGAGSLCACEVVEQLDVPVSAVHAEDGNLVLTLHLADLATLREVVSALDEVSERVQVRYLVHASADGDEDTDPAVVDRGQLTPRQIEVVRTAYEMGYFAYPREANASEVASALDINPSTFREHLIAAQSKLLSDLLGT